ncbi:unnamed protein product, partial [Prorocentrum cordatum]
CALLRVPAAAQPKVLCRRQLGVCMRCPTGEALDCTGVQLGPLLDELFAYAGPLGCAPAGDGLALSLWAPTAVRVE